MTEARAVVFLVLLALGCGGVIAYASYPRPSAARSEPAPSLRPPAPLPPLPEPPAAPAVHSDFSALPALHVTNVNTRESAAVRLYDALGRVDEAAARSLDALLADHRKPGRIETSSLDRRLLQLLVRAAHHFRVEHVEVISGYRSPRRRREGHHGAGRALDFKLPGVTAAELASYLRRQPRVGVGVYTHPRTQYVHLDVRAESYHWLDASPPGRTWRERGLRSDAIPVRDAAYARSDDWPEGMSPPEP